MEQQPTTDCGPVLTHWVTPFLGQGMQVLFDYVLDGTRHDSCRLSHAAND